VRGSRRRAHAAPSARSSDVILVLKGLSLEVPDGQIVALLGVNGAGKTSTLNAISGLLKTGDGKVTDGSIEFMGQRVDGRDPEDIRRLGIALHDCPTRRCRCKMKMSP
jgi:ABC-type branched-subunit amino acid transport system ATPase component